jgi:putative flippase GtrA
VTSLPNRIVARLPERFQGLAKEIAKFGSVGVINIAVNFAVFNLLVVTVMRHGELKANVVATVVATTGAYFMNRHWTYRDRPKATLRREYTLFFVFNLIGLTIELGVLALAKYGFGITHLGVLNAVKLVGVAIGTVFRFWTYRTYVFKLEYAAVAASDEVDFSIDPVPPVASPFLDRSGETAASSPPPVAPTAASATPTTPDPAPVADTDLDDELHTLVSEVEAYLRSRP